ncbi:MAG: NAD(P)/FAD-dependent oxidoreductase [Xanthobacteraceae bacterium]
MRERLVIVGSGMASGRMLEHLCRAMPDAFDITLFGAEPHGNYNRIMLSPVLAGEESFENIVVHDAAWYTQHKIVCRFGETVTKIDRARKVVVSARGETAYDRLVLATGSAPFILPVAGKGLPGVVAFRDFGDVQTMLAAAETPGANAVVIGGGLLGLEAAAALKKRGMDVVVLHLMAHPMELQLDPTAGAYLQRALESRGIKVHCRAQTKAILGNERAEAVLLDDGTIYPADLVVMAAGIRPETRIARDAGLHVERGIVVGDDMRTSDPDILALGECAEHADRCYGFVEPLYEMAVAAAHTLAGEQASFSPAKTATNLKVTGLSVFSAGNFAGADENCEPLVFRDPAARIYKKLILRGEKLVGVVLFGDTADGTWYLELIRSGASVADMRGELAFGRTLAMREAA